MLYTSYTLSVDQMLKAFALQYHKEDPAGQHSNPDAVAKSREITAFVGSHWLPLFMEYQYPRSLRKVFKENISDILASGDH